MKLRRRHLLLLLPATLVCVVVGLATRITAEDRATLIWHLDYEAPYDVEPGMPEVLRALQATYPPIPDDDTILQGDFTREDHPQLYAVLEKEGILMPEGSQLSWRLNPNLFHSRMIDLDAKTSVNDHSVFYRQLEAAMGGRMSASAPAGSWRNRQVHLPSAEREWGLLISQNIYWELSRHPPPPVRFTQLQIKRAGSGFMSSRTLLRFPAFTLTTSSMEYRGPLTPPLFVFTFLVTLLFYVLRRPILRLIPARKS